MAKGTDTVDITIRQAIELHCYECQGFVWDDVKNCNDNRCTLVGLAKTRPDTLKARLYEADGSRKPGVAHRVRQRAPRELTQEQREAAAARLAKAREVRA